MKNNIWQKLSQREFKGSYKTFLSKKYKLPNGSVHEFDIWYLKNGFVGVFALTHDMQVVSTVSFRPGPEKILKEPILGDIDDGEEPDKAALRELREETGCSTNQLITLGTSMAWMPYGEGNANYYLALDCELTHNQKLDSAEHIEVELIPLAQYVKNVLRKGLASHGECAWLAIDYLLRKKIISLEDIN